MRLTTASGVSIWSERSVRWRPGLACVEVAPPCAAVRDRVMVWRPPEAPMTSTMLLPLHPDSMTPAQLAAVSYLARYTGHTHALYAYQLRRWFTWPDQCP